VDAGTSVLVDWGGPPEVGLGRAPSSSWAAQAASHGAIGRLLAASARPQQVSPRDVMGALHRLRLPIHGCLDSSDLWLSSLTRLDGADIVGSSH
jgi:hypothetical protein